MTRKQRLLAGAFGLPMARASLGASRLASLLASDLQWAAARALAGWKALDSAGRLAEALEAIPEAVASYRAPRK